MKIIITEEQKNKLFIPRKLSDNDSRYSKWNNSQPIKDGVRINQYNIDGKKGGLWETDNGELMGRAYYSNGELNGECECYYKGGGLYYKGIYVNGEKDGYWEWYHPDGTLMSKRIFKNGKTVW